MMFAAGLAACAVALVLALVRAMRGPTEHELNNMRQAHIRFSN